MQDHIYIYIYIYYIVLDMKLNLNLEKKNHKLSILIKKKLLSLNLKKQLVHFCERKKISLQIFLTSSFQKDKYS